MTWIGNPVIPFPHHGGAIPKKLWVVAHSLECDARPGLAVDLARGYFQTDQVSVHGVSDPGTTVAGLDTGTQGWHAGATGNKYGNANEVTGRAGWSAAQWNEPLPRAALQRQWEWMGNACRDAGFTFQDVRWLSVAEAQAFTRGVVDHATLSLAFKESGHWDVGTGYPFRVAMANIRYYHSQECADYWGVDAGDLPGGARPGAGGGGGAEADWFSNAPAWKLLDLFS